MSRTLSFAALVFAFFGVEALACVPLPTPITLKGATFSDSKISVTPTEINLGKTPLFYDHEKQKWCARASGKTYCPVPTAADGTLLNYKTDAEGKTTSEVDASIKVDHEKKTLTIYQAKGTDGNFNVDRRAPYLEVVASKSDDDPSSEPIFGLNVKAWKPTTGTAPPAPIGSVNRQSASTPKGAKARGGFELEPDKPVPPLDLAKPTVHASKGCETPKAAYSAAEPAPADAPADPDAVGKR